ncbi:hypothetical protein OF113_12045 [Ectopseudomonas chengduensis]|nr:hypothetical protein [Pseudomonas chengduensis]UZT80737.1 hypothetical protein OF113_12045 [Pseudomonas chengduensis]
MAPNNEAKLAELLRKVDNDPHAAAELLAVAADYLKAREPMPDALADYLAHAFRRAATAPQPGDGKRIEDERISRLAEGLCLKRKEGRPRAKIPKGDVALTVAAFGETVSETKLKADLAAAYDVSTGTALARIKETKAALVEARENTREIIEHNELSGIVRPR